MFFCLHLSGFVPSSQRSALLNLLSHLSFHPLTRGLNEIKPISMLSHMARNINQNFIKSVNMVKKNKPLFQSNQVVGSSFHILCNVWKLLSLFLPSKHKDFLIFLNFLLVDASFSLKFRHSPFYIPGSYRIES